MLFTQTKLSLLQMKLLLERTGVFRQAEELNLDLGNLKEEMADVQVAYFNAEYQTVLDEGEWVKTVLEKIISEYQPSLKTGQAVLLKTKSIFKNYSKIWIASVLVLLVILVIIYNLKTGTFQAYKKKK